MKLTPEEAARLAHYHAAGLSINEAAIRLNIDVEAASAAARELHLSFRRHLSMQDRLDRLTPQQRADVKTYNSRLHMPLTDAILKATEPRQRIRAFPKNMRVAG